MYSVLLVDDEPLALEGMALLVDWTALGFRVAGQCGSGQQALEIIKRTAPDLVLTDLYMPGMGGVQLMHEAREAGYTGEFIIVSAYQDFPMAQSALKYGALGYLLKPIDEDEAVHTIGVARQAILSAAPNRWQLGEQKPEQGAPRIADQMRGYIAANYMNGITLGTMADALGHNAAYLGRLFQKQMGMGFRAFLNIYRLEEAARHIRSSQVPLYQIAEQVGYTKYAYFLTKFKQRYGVMPDQYRKQPTP